MDERTLAALKGSIAKWEAIVEGTGRDEGANNCPLCDLYYRDQCQGCLVADHADDAGCHNTPYDEWRRIDAVYANTPERKAAAQAELDFLRSLLPPDDGAPS